MTMRVRACVFLLAFSMTIFLVVGELSNRGDHETIAEMLLTRS